MSKQQGYKIFALYQLVLSIIALKVTINRFCSYKLIMIKRHNQMRTTIKASSKRVGESCAYAALHCILHAV